MQIAQKEKSPVIYNAGATKVIRFTPYAGKECFLMHWHERLEIIYVRQGEIEYIRGGEKGVLEKEQVLIIPPRTAHYAKALKDSVYDVLMFDVRYFYNDTDVCKRILPAVFEGNAVFDSVTRERDILCCVDRLCNKINPDSLEAVAEIYTLLHLFISKGLVNIFPQSRDMGMREVIEYIEHNFDKELTTSSLSDRFGYTAAHFCRKFKKATGLTPVAYIKIYRLEQAFKMIKQNEGQIFEIAQRCGFSDANYFTRCFKAHYKHPPTYYSI